MDVPKDLSESMFLLLAGFVIMSSCIAGDIIVRIPCPSAKEKNREGTSSDIPLASFPIVLYVAGEIR